MFIYTEQFVYSVYVWTLPQVQLRLAVKLELYKSGLNILTLLCCCTPTISIIIPIIRLNCHSRAACIDQPASSSSFLMNHQLSAIIDNGVCKYRYRQLCKLVSTQPAADHYYPTFVLVVLRTTSLKAATHPQNSLC